MAVRQATRKYEDLASFIDEYNKTLKAGALALSAEELKGEPAPEIKLDLVLPIVGRVGPIPAQVVSRAPDGSVGLMIPTLPEDVEKKISRLLDIVEMVKAYLVKKGDLVPKEDVAKLLAKLPQQVQTAKQEYQAPKTFERGFKVPDITSLSPVFKGTLGDRGLRDAMVQAAINKLTGILVVLSPDKKVRHIGYWLQGGPVGFRIDPLDQAMVLGVLLYRAKRLTKTQLSESLQLMEKHGIRQGEALIQMGLLNFPQLVMALQKQTELVVQQVLTLSSGSWMFYELENLPEKFITPPLGVPSMLFRACVNSAKEKTTSDLASTHRPNLDRYIFLASGIENVIEDIRFTKPEQKFLSILTSNSWRLRELFSVSNLSRMDTSSTLWAMNDMGFLEYRDEETSERYLDRVRQRIEKKARRLGASSYFDILEVHWISLPDEIERSYQSLKAEFNAKKYKNLPQEITNYINTINKALDQAYEVLSDERRRRAYRIEIIEESKIEQSAELLSKKGEMAIMKEDKREALACWGKAAELVPNNAEYREGFNRAKAL